MSRQYVAVKVILVTRQGCHLCEDALRLLQELGVDAELTDVDGDDDLHRLYDFRVPVVLIDGAVVAEGRVAREQLVAALASNPSTD
jgi:glutaredoxin